MYLFGIFISTVADVLTMALSRSHGSSLSALTDSDLDGSGTHAVWILYIVLVICLIGTNLFGFAVFAVSAQSAYRTSGSESSRFTQLLHPTYLSASAEGGSQLQGMAWTVLLMMRPEMRLIPSVCRFAQTN
jgi:hypothetical protein